jgi:GNAT superfamily N-acetyltransferase
MAVRIATESDYHAVMETIAAAFQDDPLWSWIFPDPAARWDQQTLMFGFYVQSSLPRGSVLMADDRASATIVYTPPGEPELTAEIESMVEPFLTNSLVTHAEAVLETLERFHDALPEGPPFYYVSLLGTRPNSRGRGIGMALLDEVCVEADREGKPVYLESTNPDNNHRYERHGFDRRAEFWTPNEERVVTTMWRDPR